MAAMHKCAADGCTKRVGDRFLMCGPCWRYVPPEIQRRVYDAYVSGQTVATASDAWWAATKEAVAAVKQAREGGRL